MFKYWQKLKGWQKGVLVGILVSIVGIIGILIFSYKGTCVMGGEFDSSWRRCGLIEYLLLHIPVLAVVFIFYAWWIILPFILICSVVGYSIDRFHRKGIIEKNEKV